MNIKKLKEIVYKSAIPAMEIYARDFKVEYKDDKSPLTEADKAVNEIILSELEKEYPEIPIISEESKLTSFSDRSKWDKCFIIDPIDGTKEFIKKNDEFTINLAYCEDEKVVMGVVYAPALKLMYYCDDKKAYREIDGNIETLPCESNEDFTILKSRSHMNKETEDYIHSLECDFKLIEAGSSLKFCLIAQGSGHLYPRFGPTMEWDTAAAQAILEKAGGEVVRVDTNMPLTYNKENLKNPHFIARVRKSS